MENKTTLLENTPLEFTLLDYVLFLTMLLLSALIGIYFGFIKKQSTADDYLLGGKKMSVTPIAMSMISRYLCTRFYFYYFIIIIIYISIYLSINHASYSAISADSYNWFFLFCFCKYVVTQETFNDINFVLLQLWELV